MQRGKFPLAFALAILGSQAVWADLTIRYEFDVKLSAAFPAGSSKAFKKQIAGMFPSGIVIRVKGDQCANSFGRLSTIVDKRQR
jgi:hypothetical protein